MKWKKKIILKMIIHFKDAPQEMTFSPLIYRQYRKYTFPLKKNIPDSPQTQSTDLSERGTRKDHFTNLIPIPSTKHPTD